MLSLSLALSSQAVMPGLVPGIHVFVRVDGRVKPGYDR
jgi:hypothetical protein